MLPADVCVRFFSVLSRLQYAAHLYLFNFFPLPQVYLLLVILLTARVPGARAVRAVADGDVHSRVRGAFPSRVTPF